MKSVLTFRKSGVNVNYHGFQVHLCSRNIRMALPEPLLLDEELENQCNEIRAIASKNWLSSAHSSLQHLDQIKTSVYNVGIHDPKDLKATNLSHRGQRSQSYTDLANTPNGPPVTLQKNAIAWGSNGSIPDLLAQHSARSQMSEKPSVRRNRPTSGKKSRPQSAKELHNVKGSQLPPRAPSIGVKGARVDPSGRPPKTVHHTSTGWVGPPAGLKFADDLPTDIPCDILCGRISSGGSPPPAPAGSPIPQDVDDNDIEQNEVINTEPPKTASPEPIHFSLPRMEDDYEEEDSDLDTERLLAKTEEHAPTPVVTENTPGFTYTHSKSNKPNTGQLEVNGQDDATLPSRILKEKLDNNSLSSHVNTLPDDCDDLFEEDDDSLEDDWDEELAELDHKESSFIGLNEKTSVKFREDKNVTIDITPRNLGYKVADMETHSKKKRHSPQNRGELESVLSIISTGPPKNHIPTIEMNQDTKHTVERKASQENCEISKKPKPLNSALKQRTPGHDTKCEKRLTHERPRSANKPSTPVTTVSVAYSDMNEVRRSSKSKGSKKRPEKDVVTMVEGVVSDNEEEESVSKADKEGITPDKLESWMPTKCVSEPPKNYYELSRRSTSVQSHFRETTPQASNHTYKTTKTIEFDEYKPRETTIKNVIDASGLLKSRDRERFVGLDEEHRVKVRPSSERPHYEAPKERLTNRPSSEMSQKIKSSQNGELPVGKLGAVATHLDKVKSVEKKMLRRPLSATHNQRKSEVSQQKEECTDTLKGTVNEKVNLSHSSKPELSEREKEIENLINKHLRRNDAATPVCKPEDSTLPEPGASDNKMTEEIQSSKMDEEKETEDITHDQKESVEVKERPPSGGKVKSASRKPKKNYEDIETLVSGTYKCTLKAENLKENKVNKIVLKMAETKVNAKLTDNSKHYASYSRSRVRTAPLRRVASEPKVRYTKPLFINSKNPDDDIFTENEIEAHQLHQRLAAADVFIRPETLERALYPPSGKTLYYDVENKLPRSTSASLLSHPKVWLPVEYKQFKLAEKNLDRANEIMRRRELAEERKARLAELGSAAKKKKGKKKGGKKKGAASGKSKAVC
ncbi:titin-like [Saccostrea cucullata]|uniref:titin-like n=1 Tax=Saccostrea cuccullata TaxID=36930 RepID=UPI002ED3111F